MRYKKARFEKIDDKWLCTGCLTRYSEMSLAIKCVEGHNTEAVSEANRFIEEIKTGGDKGI
jgi:hypothetical protein